MQLTQPATHFTRDSSTLDRWQLFYFAVLIALGICVGTGIFTFQVGSYSTSIPYRRQTEALLQGHLALSSSPSTLQFDQVWANGGVHQVWGLGVPLIWLPFQAICHLCGEDILPDRGVFVIVMVIFVYLTLRVFAEWPQRGKNCIEYKVSTFLRAILALLLILFPPFLALCRGPFNVYTQPEVYGYLACTGLFVGLLRFSVSSRSLMCYMVISAFAGFVVFIRPTLGAYGLTSMALAFLFTRKDGWPWGRSLLGVIVFTVLVSLLMVTNILRFGAALEFGHRLNLTEPCQILASRFGYPYAMEPLIPAAKELLGSMFLVEFEEPTGGYTNGHSLLQSSTPRWRQFGFKTFDVSFALAGLLGWIAAVFRLIFARERGFVALDSTLLLAGVWSFFGIAPIFAFYLRFFGIADRYMMDFAPGIAVAMIGGVISVWNIDERKKRFQGMTIIMCVGWWLWEVTSAVITVPDDGMATKKDVTFIMTRFFERQLALPTRYAAGESIGTSSSFLENYIGLKPSLCGGTLVILLAQDPTEMTLRLEAGTGGELTEQDCSKVQAKVGLELLRIVSSQATRNGRIMVFSKPMHSTNYRNIQVIFISLGDGSFSGPSPRFHLVEATWNK